jgi:hypothetical protein
MRDQQGWVQFTILTLGLVAAFAWAGAR